MPRPSPFPGMDPYLEQHWRDVHASMIIYARDQLRELLPAGLKARVEERVFVDRGAAELQDRYPDVRVTEDPRSMGGAASTAAGTAVAEPLVIPVTGEPLTETFLEVRDAGSENRIVTVLEFLSPTNKRTGEGHDQYVGKQQELLAGRVSLVEIDLLRSGKHVLAVPLSHIPAARRTPFMACVRRAWKPGIAEVYPVTLWEPLPTIKVPLRETDRDVPLNLQSLIERAYQNGGYEDTDYRQEPDPPLSAADQAWADELLRGQGLR